MSEAERKTAAVDAAAPPEEAPSSPPVNILLVDDDRSNLISLESLLSCPEYRLVSVETAEEALKALMDEEFALLMLDVRMPSVNGLELAQLIKQRKSLRHLPIIFLSAFYQEDEHAVRGYGVGAVDYLTKPFNPVVLKSKVAAFVELYRMNRALHDEISERKEIERRLEERSAEVQELVTQLRSLTIELSQTEQRERRRLAGVLHDHLQQLLVSAHLQLGFLRSGAKSDDVAETMSAIEGTIKDALSVSRSVTVELCPPAFHEGGLAAGLEWFAENLRRKHGFEVELDIPSDVKPASAEEGLVLFECARELVFNAFKHSGVSSANVAVSRSKGGRVRIVVEDNGQGFDQDSLAVKGEGQSMFGLFSVQQRVAHLGGSFKIKSRLGLGTKISILAGTCADDEPALDGIETGPAAAHDALPVMGTKDTDIEVLIVDDHTILRHSLERMLDSCNGISVIASAGNRTDAVKFANELLPDVILMDVNLAGDSGVELTETLLTMHPAVKVIGLSMHVEEEVMRSMREAGAVAYLSKDAASEELVATIRKICHSPHAGHPVERG